MESIVSLLTIAVLVFGCYTHRKCKSLEVFNMDANLRKVDLRLAMDDKKNKFAELHLRTQHSFFDEFTRNGSISYFNSKTEEEDHKDALDIIVENVDSARKGDNGATLLMSAIIWNIWSAYHEGNHKRENYAVSELKRVLDIIFQEKCEEAANDKHGEIYE